jgi:hypothetical protein
MMLRLMERMPARRQRWTLVTGGEDDIVALRASTWTWSRGSVCTSADRVEHVEAE